MTTQVSPGADEWDDYWKSSRRSQAVYGYIADFYRKRIISQSLQKTFEREVPHGSLCLHAGSGSGEVDIAITPCWNIVALDFSLEACIEYQKRHELDTQIVRGDNFWLPFKDNTFRAVFNLGVMEHFSKDEALKMFSEFNRVLVPNGKLLIFWPPKYGLSVITLRIFHWVVRWFRPQFRSLHPAEISLIGSRQIVSTWLREAGFKSVNFRFGPGDLFTHEIVTASN